MNLRPGRGQPCPREPPRLPSRTWLSALLSPAGSMVPMHDFGTEGALPMNRAFVAAVVKRRRLALRNGSANSHWRLQSRTWLDSEFVHRGAAGRVFTWLKY